jgi:hypothetical protein
MKIFQGKLKCLNNDFDGFIQTIKHHQNEIVTDGEYICQLISQLVQTNKVNEKKKRKYNQETSLLIHQLKFTIDQHDGLTMKFKQQMNIHLLELLKQCQHWSIFNEYRTDFEQLIQQTEQQLAIDDNRQFTISIIRHINCQTIIHEQSSCFDMIIQLFNRSIKKSKATTSIDLIILTLKQVELSSE